MKRSATWFMQCIETVSTILEPADWDAVGHPGGGGSPPVPGSAWIEFG